MKDKIVVLSYGDNPKVSTGYGCVWENLLSRWAKLKPNWEFYHLGWQNKDRPHKTLEGYWMLPMGKMEYGFDTVIENLLKFNPDIFVTLCDVGWQSGFMEQVFKAKQQGWRGKWIMYTPMDTDAWAMTWKEIFDSPDLNVAMAGFGELMMKKRGVPNVIMIPHGVDTKTFYPIDKEQLKVKHNLSGKFVVGFVGRNQTRKMLDRILMGFADFAKDKKDTVILLHTDAEPPQQGWSLKYLQWLFKIEDKLKLTRGNLDIDQRQKINPEGMNEIYNLMDVFCYGTGGEGFGLPGLECQSCGVPLLMTDCTTAMDLCREENRIPILKDIYGRNSMIIGTNGVNFVVPDDKKMSELLEERYKEWKEGKLKERGEEARKFSLKYDWQGISEQWIQLFEKAI